MKREGENRNYTILNSGIYRIQYYREKRNYKIMKFNIREHD